MNRTLLTYLLTTLCGVLAVLPLLAQTPKVVTGKVTDTEGQPVIGVTVIEQGRSVGGTSTNASGNYTINISNPEAILLFSFIGMESKQEKVGGRSTVDVVLHADAIQMDEVVAIGYGSARRSDLTGSVASVSSEVFEDKLVTSMEDALRGQVAGVRVLANDGTPGEELNIRLRGSGSLNASNSPIYVIDGIVMENADINPSDIESMEILKDASSTAIYGSKGSNGVIIITTKRGKTEKVTVRFDASTSFQNPVRVLEMMDTEEFSTMLNMNAFQYFKREDAGLINFGAATRKYYTDSEGNYWQYDMMNKWSNIKYHDQSNPEYVNSDWQKAMLADQVIQSYNINVSGGDDKSSFSVMGGYLKQPGIVRYSDFNRASIRANYSRAIDDKGSNFGFNLSGTRSTQNASSGNDTGISMNMLSQAPTKALSALDWETEGSENIYENNNPLYQAKVIKRETQKMDINMRTFFDVALTSKLKFTIAGNFKSNENGREEYFPKDVSQGRNANGRATNAINRSFYWNSENLINYNPKLTGKHTYDLMGGVVIEETYGKRNSSETHNFQNENLNTSSMQDGIELYRISTNNEKTRMVSFFSRGNYAFDHKYLLTASIRFDGSSRFGPNNKWGIFPSGAFAWRVSEEKWMKKVDFVSNLKLRFSAGVTGNSSIPSLQSLDVMTRVLYPENGIAPSYGISTDRPANLDLKWETSRQYDVGLDFGLLNNRLSGTIELYSKQTRDLLFNQPVPYSYGYENQWSNIASVDNNGLEITVEGIPIRSKSIRKGVNWRINYNMAFNRSKVRSLGGASELPLTAPNTISGSTNYGILQVGKPLGNWYGYQADGIWQLQSQINALPDEYSSVGTSKDNMRPGNTRFLDYNNDGTVNEYDRVILGNSQPDFTGGLTNFVSFYGFTLTLGLEFTVGGEIFKATARELMQLNSNSGRNQLAAASNFWRPNLYDINTGEIAIPGNEYSNIKMPMTGWENVCTDRFIEDATYLRIDNISLSYDLPENVLNKIRLQRCSFYVAVRNAYVFTNYTGYDPDVNVGSGIYADLLPKLDGGSLPRSRSITLGTSITF